LPLIDLDANLDHSTPSLGNNYLNWSVNTTLHNPALPTNPSGSIYNNFTSAFAVNTDNCKHKNIDNALEEHNLGLEALQAAKPLFEPQSLVLLDTEGIVLLSLVASVVHNTLQTHLR
jgi:hypothetical protein